MKKVNLMMLSLISLAVIGGALAFKAKVVFRYCTTDALYYDDPDTLKPDFYYCRLDAMGRPVPTIENPGTPPTNTLNCDNVRPNVTDFPLGIINICTSNAAPLVDTDLECRTVKCPNTTSIQPNM